MTATGKPIDVLLVEDDPGDELMTREAFEDNKIRNTLHVVRDGEQALDFLYQRGDHTDSPRPDLILLDLNLPKYDGRQVLEKIKSDPELSHIPVVVLTTSSAEEDICEATGYMPTRTSRSPSTWINSFGPSSRSTNSSCR